MSIGDRVYGTKREEESPEELKSIKGSEKSFKMEADYVFASDPNPNAENKFITNVDFKDQRLYTDMKDIGTE